MPEPEMNEYGARLARLEHHAMTTERRLDEHGSKLDAHSSKLDAIFAAVTKQDAVPRFSFNALLATVKDIGILVAMGAGAIIYVASNIASAPLALVKADQQSSMALIQRDIASLTKRLDSAEFARNWKAEVTELQRR